MDLPRFTLRDMFVATTLIAVAIGTAAITIRYTIRHQDDASDAIWAMPVLLGCGATTGAGVFTPFHRKRLGAFLGAAMMVVLVLGRLGAILGVVFVAVFYAVGIIYAVVRSFHT